MNWKNIGLHIIFPFVIVASLVILLVIYLIELIYYILEAIFLGWWEVWHRDEKDEDDLLDNSHGSFNDLMKQLYKITIDVYKQ